MPKRNRSKKNILKNISEASFKKIMQLKKKLLKGGMSETEALKAAQNAYKKGGEVIMSNQNDGVSAEGQAEADAMAKAAAAEVQGQSAEATEATEAQAQADAEANAQGEVSQATPVTGEAPQEEGYFSKLVNSLKFWGGKNRGKSKNRRNRSKRNKKQTNKKRN
jgi:hypothetical protein